MRIVIAVVAIVVVFLGYNYGYEYVSASAVISKYESATNSDIELQGFTLKGSVTFANQYGFGDPAALETDLAAQRSGEKFDFKMAFQAPDKSAVEMVQNGQIMFKEVFADGSGWLIDGVNGKPGLVQEKKNGFGLKRMGVGIDHFDSVEFTDGSAEREFALGRSILLKARTALTVGGNKIALGDKVSIRAMSVGNGPYDPTILVFDRSSGLLIGMVKQEKMGSRDVTTTVFFDDYRKFPFKPAGFFSFLKSGQVTLPTQWTFVVGLEQDPRIANPYSMVMTFNVAEVDLMGSVDPMIFRKP